MQPKILRSAGDLFLERERKERARQASGHDTAMQSAITSIEDAHRSGKRSVFCLTFPDSVVKELEANGYTVKYHSACNAGDMDSHEISWP